MNQPYTQQKASSDAYKVANQLKKAIKLEKGETIAKFFDINFLKEKKEPCQLLVKENISKALGHDLWMEAFSFLFQVPLCDSEIEAFELYNQAANPLIRDFKSLVSNLGVPCIKTIAKSYHFYATNADYNESVNQMQKLLRLALSTNNNIFGGSALLTVVNELMAVYFQRNNINQAQNLLLTVENKINFRNFTPSEVSTYYFYSGRVNAILLNIAQAHQDLINAYETCPLRLYENRRLILVYLIPVQFFYGKLPTTKKGLIEYYKLEIFTSFANSIVLGQIRNFDKSLRDHQLILFQLGIYQLVSSARKLVYYQILRIAYELYGSLRMPVDVFLQALIASNEEDDYDDEEEDELKYTIDEAESIAAMLIEMKLVKAYIHHGLHFIVFAKDPFQPLSVYD